MIRQARTGDIVSVKRLQGRSKITVVVAEVRRGKDDSEQNTYPVDAGGTYTVMFE
jgi:hypothetical protein